MHRLPQDRDRGKARCAKPNRNGLRKKCKVSRQPPIANRLLETGSRAARREWPSLRHESLPAAAHVGLRVLSGACRCGWRNGRGGV